MKKIFVFPFLLVFCYCAQSQEKQPVDYVNPLIGTDFHGHTYPGATMPHGMVQLSPDTRIDGWDGCSGYHFSDKRIFGFSHTHLSGTGCSDYGDILIAPYQSRKPLFKNNDFSSDFQHVNEIARAGYYSVLLDTWQIKAELTATARVGCHRYTFPKKKNARITLDLSHRGKTSDAWVKVLNDRQIVGYRKSSAWALDRSIYFALELSQPFVNLHFAKNINVKDTTIDGRRTIVGPDVIVALGFDQLPDNQLEIKVALSAVSPEGALKNLQAEVPDFAFDQVAERARRAWNSELKRIEVEGGTSEQLTTFYTALYHCLIVPNIFSDVDGKYLCRDGIARNAYDFTPYTVFSLWDTYRAWHPLMTIIDTARVVDYIRTFLSQYRYGRRLPMWELAAYETNCMIGYHAVSVIADAWQKGIRNFDGAYALQAMLNSAKRHLNGVPLFRRFNFIPADQEHEAVSKTLEYAYDDWCIAQVARSLNDSLQYQKLMKRAQAYKNLFDPATHLMRPRINGGWKLNFNPAEVDQHFTEANSLQYSFYAPHDLDGLIALHGGAGNFEAKLDQLFSAPSQLVGRSQPDITGLIGQYAHGNEPSHHVAYLYNFVGKPWKTQRLVRQIMDGMYSPQPDGLCGNEDCGQMSAWYVLSAMGFYPVCPGNTAYSIGTPLFKRVTINLESGRKFRIEADDVSSQNIYIQRLTLNGREVKSSFIDHSDIMAGGTLRFKMGESPDSLWASQPVDLPHTAINAPDIAIAPTLDAPSHTFSDMLEFDISSPQPEAVIFHAVIASDAADQRASWVQGAHVKLTGSATVRAYALGPNQTASAVVEGQFVKVQQVSKVSIKSKYDNLYTGGGDLALVDGLRGAANYRLGRWQGYQGQDFEAVVDLGREQNVNYLGTSFLQDVSPWIMMPRYVDFALSSDGRNFEPLGRVVSDIPDTLDEPKIKEFGIKTSKSARYVKVFAKSYGPLPAWHLSAGQPSWLFVDEVIIRCE